VARQAREFAIATRWSRQKLKRFGVFQDLGHDSNYLNWESLGLSPIAVDLGFFVLRWYALSYLAMIILGWWYVRILLSKSGAPMSRDHLDKLINYVTIGVIAGGRLGYTVIYQPSMWRNPVDVLKLWEGGMSLHGGFLGVMIALWIFTRRNRLSLLRVCDYIACATPFGLVLVRLANFTNGELWGRVTDVPWAMIFPGSQDGLPRHPSQLYEAVAEGLVSGALLYYLFWMTNARFHPGRLFGTALVAYGGARFLMEYFRQPDRGLEALTWGLTMGQTLSLPMFLVGLVILLMSRRSAAIEVPRPAKEA
jgi:phosphatidylglycerol---prolipoprotein diacylglyceryl transferase